MSRPAGRSARLYPPTMATCTSVAFSPDGTVLATGDADHAVELWDVPSVVSRSAAIHWPHRSTDPDAITSVAFSPDGATLAAGDSSGTDPAVGCAHVIGRSGRCPADDAGSILDVVFSPDGALLAARTADGRIQLWDVAQRRLLGAPLDAHAGGLTSMAMSPNGTILAASYPDGTIRLWDVARRRQLGAPLTSQYGEIAALAFSPNGKILASGSYGDTVQLWNVATHRPRGAPLRRPHQWRAQPGIQSRRHAAGVRRRRSYYPAVGCGARSPVRRATARPHRRRVGPRLQPGWECAGLGQRRWDHPALERGLSPADRATTGEWQRQSRVSPSTVPARSWRPAAPRARCGCGTWIWRPGCSVPAGSPTAT